MYINYCNVLYLNISCDLYMRVIFTIYYLWGQCLLWYNRMLTSSMWCAFNVWTFSFYGRGKEESDDRIHRKSCRYKIVTAAETSRVHCYNVNILLFHTIFAKRSVYCAWVSLSSLYFHYLRRIKILSRMAIGKFSIYIIWIYLCMSVSPPQFSSYVPCPFIATFVISPTNFQVSCIIMARIIKCSLPTPKSVMVK